MAKIIAIANHKGGVGKTTSVASIGAILANGGYRTLIIDLDSQANLTRSFLEEEPEDTIYKALKGYISLPILNLKENLDIVCSSLEMGGVELELSEMNNREFILKGLLEPLQDKYDYVLLDCPPSLGIVTLNALVAATELYVPMLAETLPSIGLQTIEDIIEMTQENLNSNISLSGIIITRWRTTNLTKMIEEQIRETFGDIVFNTKIRDNITIAEAPLFLKDIITHAPRSNGAKDYQSLTTEIISRFK